MNDKHEFRLTVSKGAGSGKKGKNDRRFFDAPGRICRCNAGL